MIAPISPISLYKPKLAQSKSKSCLLSHCGYDKVSFKSKEEHITQGQYQSAKERLYSEALKRCLMTGGIEEILSLLTPKSYKYFDKILDCASDLKKEQIIKIIDYINSAESKTDDLDEKFGHIYKLPKIFENLVKNKYGEFDDFYASVIQNYGILNFLKSDIFMDSKIGPLSPTDKSLEFIFETMRHTLDKKLKLNTAKNIGKLNNINRSFNRLYIVLDVSSDIVPIFAAARILDKQAFNELWYNNQSDLEIYCPLISEMKAKDYKMLRDIVTKGVQVDKDGKSLTPVSLKNKILAISLIGKNRFLINQKKESVPFSEFISKNYVVDFEKLKESFIIPTLIHCGLSRNEAQEYLKNYKKNNNNSKNAERFWDSSLLPIVAGLDDKYLKTLIKDTTLGRFKSNLHNPNSEYGEINLLNRDIISDNDINYELWLNPDILPKTKNFISKNGEQKIFTAKMWDRNPMKSLFDGNYTTCCTGINKSHGDSFPKFLMNTAFNTIEVRDEKGKVVGMTRLFLAKLNKSQQPSIVVENIEVNNLISKKYLYDDETKIKYREMVFDYVRDLAKSINKNKERKIPVYFCAERFKVKRIDKGLKKPFFCNQNAIIGEVPYPIYINAHRGTYYPDGDLRMLLIDITSKD